MKEKETLQCFIAFPDLFALSEPTNFGKPRNTWGWAAMDGGNWPLTGRKTWFVSDAAPIDTVMKGLRVINQGPSIKEL